MHVGGQTAAGWDHDGKPGLLLLLPLISGPANAAIDIKIIAALSRKHAPLPLSPAHFLERQSRRVYRWDHLRIAEGLLSSVKFSVEIEVNLASQHCLAAATHCVQPIADKFTQLSTGYVREQSPTRRRRYT